MLITALVTLVLDLYTKQLAIEHLGRRPTEGYPFGRAIQVIPGFFDLTWAENTGGAFSFLHTQPWVIAIVAGIMVVGIVIWAYRLPRSNAVIQLAFGLIIGGAVGNLIDRMRFRYVVDFLDFYYVSNGQKHAWPTFNVADIAIVCGIGLFMYLTAFTKLLDPLPVPPGGEAGTPDDQSKTFQSPPST